MDKKNIYKKGEIGGFFNGDNLFTSYPQEYNKKLVRKLLKKIKLGK